MKPSDENRPKSLGVVTSRKVGDAIKVTVPSEAHVEAGAQYAVTLDADGKGFSYREIEQQPTNFWDSDDVQNHDFAKDQQMIGELQGHRAGREA